MIFFMESFMSIVYYKLLDLLNRRGLKKGDLIQMADVSNNVIAKLAKNRIVTTDTIDRICAALQCQPGDIMEWIPDEEKTE